MAAKKRSPISKWKPAPEPWVKAFNAAVTGVMTGFALAPESFVRRPKELRAWLDRSIEYASSLPAKKKR